MLSKKLINIIVDNQYEVLNTFVPNKSYAYLLNVESINSVFLNHNTEFEDQNTDQNGRKLEIEDRVSWTLFISK